jgi:hypothetical protein
MLRHGTSKVSLACLLRHQLLPSCVGKYEIKKELAAVDQFKILKMYEFIGNREPLGFDVLHCSSQELHCIT